MKNKKNIRTIIKATTTFLLLSVMFCVMNIYGATSTYIHGIVNISAKDSGGKLVFTTSGLKLDSDYTSENTEYLSSSDWTAEMYLITNYLYGKQGDWRNALNAGAVKLLAQRTFTKNGSNNYSWANDLSGTYTVTSTSTMKKILEHVSSPTISAGTLENAYSFSTGSWSYAINIGLNSSFTFKYYYFYTHYDTYVVDSKTLNTGYTVMYKVNNGSWKDCGTASYCNIPTSELSAGDTVYIKLVDSLGMGYESNTITVKVHSLTVKPNEGTWSSSTSNQTYLMLEGQTMTIPVPTRDNYSFNKWSLSGTGSSMSSYTAQATFTMGTANATLTANWTSNIHTLTINPNGGSMYNGDSKTDTSFTISFLYGRKTYMGSSYNNGKNYYSDNTPTRAGYTFDGWTFSNGSGGLNTSDSTFYFGTDTTYSANSTNTYIFNGNYAGDVTATANWTANTYILTVDPAGGTWTYNGNDYTSAHDISMTCGSTKTIANPTRTGYTFTGWTVSNSSSSISNGTFTMGTGDTILTATWSQNSYTLTIDPNRGSMYNGSSLTTSSFTTSFLYGRLTYMGNLATGGGYIPKNEPTRTGYTFTGWTLQDSSTGQILSSPTYQTSSDASAYKNTSGSTFYFGTESGGASNTNTYIFNGKYAGNVTATANWVDNLAPDGDIKASPSNWTTGNVIITATGSDNGSGLKSIEILNGNGYVVLKSSTSPVTWTDKTEGVEKYTARITDNAGNVTRCDEKKEAPVFF